MFFVIAVADAVAITTRLFLGPPEAAGLLRDLIPVETAGDAMTAIQSGHSALLPAGAWELAAAVLRGFGASEEHITFRLEMAGYPGEQEPVARSQHG